MKTWKEELDGRIDPELSKEIDAFETQIQLRCQGQMDEKVFAESRLRRGVYGQRYDNGSRHDGIRRQTLDYPSGDVVKGPETLWDASGMQRIKIPFGGVTPDQLDVLADLAEEYSSGVAHITTRQDFQLHFVHIEDTPSMMRRLASVGITTREACGNSVRNVTACPLAGVCQGEIFDVTPYSRAMHKFLLGHPDTQDFGRKFKVAFSGCRGEACGLAKMHDLGLIAAVSVEDGVERRGFECYVGGGLGAVPHQATLLDDFLPVEELLPTAQAIARVFARLGEKENRSRARFKFLVAKLGIDEFRRLLKEERERMPQARDWFVYSENEHEFARESRELVQLDMKEALPGFKVWHQANVSLQRQQGFGTVTIALPLGDMSSSQLRAIGKIARRYSQDQLRTTVEQNILLRWVELTDLPEIYEELNKIGLADPVAGTIADVTACPGTDTCKLGIASSRGLAAEIRKRLSNKSLELDEAVTDLRIKISGCFNSCGQHHIADLGFYGTSRTVSNRKVPHFQVVLGGSWGDNAGAYGMGIGSVPSRSIPFVIERITGRYVEDRINGEPFKDFVGRIGKKDLRGMIQDLTKVPSYEEDPTFYSDWGDPREFSMGDMGIGECAGEVVSLIDFDLAEAERILFEAQVSLDEGDVAAASQGSLEAMIQAAKGLVKTEFLDVPNKTETIVSEFKERFYDTKIFFDRFAKGKFANYLLRRHANPGESRIDGSRQLVEEAQLFIEATHACYAKIAESRIAEPSIPISSPRDKGLVGADQ